jgi:hypothetical protein
MDPITTALAAGTGYVLNGMAGEAVKDAYKALRDLLVGKLSSLVNLEEDPEDEDYRKAAEKELQRKGLADDTEVLEKAGSLLRMIEQESPEKLATASIDIGDLRAARDVIVRRLHSTGGVRIRNVTAQGVIDIQDVSAGAKGKS